MLDARAAALVVCLCAFTIALSAYADTVVRTSEPLTAAYQPTRQSVLLAGAQPAAVLLIPEDDAFAHVAADLNAALQAKLGVALPTMPEREYMAAVTDARTVIVVGNYATGPLALRLYANKLIVSDGHYPGATGFELRTIPDALDLGVNVIFVGASSPESAAEGIAKFLDLVEPADTVALEHFIEFRSPNYVSPGAVSEDDAARRVQTTRDALRAFASDPFRSACGQFINAATAYYVSGETSWAALCGDLVDLLAAAYTEMKPSPPTFILADIVMAIDQVDDCPEFGDAHRLVAAEWLRRMIEDTMGFWEMRDPIRRWENSERRPIWNHETYPAVGVALGAQYLKPHYGVAAADWWAAVCENLFAGQMDCDQPLEDSANYQWSVTRHMLTYVLATGRLHEWLEGPALRQFFDYAIASHDNNGDEATHGDAWQAFGSTAGGVFAVGVAQFHDPAYQWMRALIGIRPNPGLWSFSGEHKAQAPAEHIGLRTFMVHPAREAAFGIQGVPTGRALDKAVFRGGWDPADDYLMLDGLNVGNHKHLDANAIIRLVANRRLWLVDMDYIRAAPKYHNSIALVRDGLAPDQRPTSNRDAQVIAAQPFAAELTCEVGSADLAMTQSVLRDYGGADWERSVFWRASEFTVVVDRLTALQAGDYIAKCHWRTLGDVTFEGNTLAVTQKGMQRTGSGALQVLEDDGRTVVELSKPDARLAFTRTLDAGRYAVNIVACGPSGSSDSVWLRVDGAEPIDYHLPIGQYAGSSATWEKLGPGRPLAIDRDGEHAFEISLRESPGVRIDSIVLTRQGHEPVIIEAEQLVAGQVEAVSEPEQRFIIACAAADGIRPKLTQSFDYGHGGRDGYYADYPYADKMTRILIQNQRRQLQAGERMTFANLLVAQSGDAAAPRGIEQVARNAWRVGAEPVALVGFSVDDIEGLDVQADMFVLTADRLMAAGANRIAIGDTEWAAQEPALIDVRFGEQGEPAALAGIAPADVDGLLARIAALDPAVLTSPPAPPAPPALPVHWTADLGSPVTALASGEAGVLCGLEDGRIVLLSVDGERLWQHELGSKVRSVGLARFAAGVVALAGTEAGDVRALSVADGAELWTYACQPFHGRSGSVASVFPADLDGDGFHEVIAGSDNWHHHALSAAGELLWRTDTTHASTVGCAGDITGDGRDDVIAGTEYYWPRLLDADGKDIRRTSGGPVTTAVAAVDLDGDGKASALIGMDDCFIRCHTAEKADVWVVNVGGSPTRIAPMDVNGDGRPEIVCSSESFSIYAIDGAGTVLWRTQLPEAATDLTVVGEGIVATCDDGRAYVLAPDGSIRGACACDIRPTAVVALGADLAVVAAGDGVLAFRIRP
ncbi:MAG TPA: hypothetical protein DGT21_05835 [Armatimonadetes bacterium]|nr:hypothetical protein [Armatimonadota bacterium]